MKEQFINSAYLKIREISESRDWDYWVAPDGAITHMSPSCEAMTGYKASEFLQKPDLITRIIHPEDQWEVGELFRCMESALKCNIEFRIITAFKTVRWLSRSHQKVISDMGTHAGIRVINKDITFQKNLEQQHRPENEHLEQFAYAAAHDLREPLVAVAAQLKALELHLKENKNENVQRSLSKAINIVLGMDSMLQGFFARYRVNTRALSHEVSDANECLRNALSDLAFSIKKTGTTVTNDYLPSVKIDASRLMTIFSNLIANSIRFRGSEPLRIHVGCTSGRSSVSQFHVSDNGMGMEAPCLERILKLLDRTPDCSLPSGPGLGLLTCRKIIERHGGNLWLDSRPQSGAIYYFTLPKAAMETFDKTPKR